MRYGKLIMGILGMVVIMLTLNRCAPVYLPPSANVPLLHYSGDMQAGVYAGTSGLDLQGSYAVSDNIGIQGTFSSGLGGDNRHTYGEFGIGYYHAIMGGNFSVFGGLSAGKATANASHISINGNPVARTASGNLIRPYLQGVAALNTRIVDVGLAFRGAYVQVSDLYLNGTRTNDDLGALFIEPIGFLNLGWDQVKINMQGGIAVPTNSVSFDWNLFSMSIGLQFYFPLKVLPQGDGSPMY